MSRKGSAVESHLAGVEIGRGFSNKFTDSSLFTRPSFLIFACLALLVIHYMLHTVCDKLSYICANTISVHMSVWQKKKIS